MSEPERIDVESLDRNRTEQPAGYRDPNLAYLVEWETPAGDPEVIQVGAFTTQEEAERMMAYATATPTWRGRRLHINMVAVHERLEDWLWDE